MAAERNIPPSRGGSSTSPKLKSFITRRALPSAPQPNTAGGATGGVKRQSAIGDIGGAIGAGAALVFGGPTAVVGGAIVGFLVGETAGESLNYREMSDAEMQFANETFRGTLPNRGKIIITSMSRPNNRAFTLPVPSMSQLPLLVSPPIAALALAEGSLVRGHYLVNMGTDWVQPVKTNMRTFIHELTHVWQAFHSGFFPSFMCEGFINGVRDNLGDRVRGDLYGGNKLEGQFREHNLESQAVWISTWTADFNPRSQFRWPRLDRYVRDNIWTGNPYADCNPTLIGSGIIHSPGSNVSVPRLPRQLMP